MKGQLEIAYLPKFADLYVKRKRISGVQSNFIHFELLIASLAQLLTELLQFKVLTFFVALMTLSLISDVIYN